MTKNNVLKGVFLVGLVQRVMGCWLLCKIAYGEGFTTAEVTVAQFVMELLEFY
jgi:hypothetical protein